MKTYLITAALALLFVSCEKKEETTINPPAENKTTIVTPPATEKTTEKKTETDTTVTPGATNIQNKHTTEEQK